MDWGVVEEAAEAWDVKFRWCGDWREEPVLFFSWAMGDGLFWRF